jgi:prevent-host-death family protein
MATRTPRRRAQRPQPLYDEPLRLPAAEFKAKCLGLMDHVRETGAEYVVTKHGRPVAKLVPYTPPKKASFFGSMKGTVLRYDRPFDPIDDEWDINRD